jgi:hypothetical protein
MLLQFLDVFCNSSEPKLFCESGFPGKKTLFKKTFSENGQIEILDISMNELVHLGVYLFIFIFILYLFYNSSIFISQGSLSSLYFK